MHFQIRHKRKKTENIILYKGAFVRTLNQGNRTRKDFERENKKRHEDNRVSEVFSKTKNSSIFAIRSHHNHFCLP